MANEKDFTEKLLFALSDVFADIINVLIYHGKAVVDSEDLLADETISDLKLADGLHMQERDVSKIWTKGNVRFALIGIENQTAQDKDMPLRIISYDGASYKAQVNQHRAAERSKDPKEKPYPVYPVVSFVLYFGMEKWAEPKSLLDCFEVDIPEEMKPYISNYHINVVNVAWLDDETVKLFKSDFRLVADYFIQKRKNGGDYKPPRETIQHVHEFLAFLNAVSGDKRYLAILADPEFQENVRKGDVTMCEVLDNVEKRGVEKGRAEGFKKGIAVGEERGEKRGENKLALLMKALFAANRFEDADKASTDEIRRSQLYQEFGIQ